MLRIIPFIAAVNRQFRVKCAVNKYFSKPFWYLNISLFPFKFDLSCVMIFLSPYKQCVLPAQALCSPTVRYKITNQRVSVTGGADLTAQEFKDLTLDIDTKTGHGKGNSKLTVLFWRYLCNSSGVSMVLLFPIRLPYYACVGCYKLHLQIYDPNEFDALADAINSDLNTSRNHWIKIQIRYQSDFVCMTPKLLWRCFIICFIWVHWSRKRTNSVRKWFQGLDGKDITEFSYQVDSETLKVSLQISSKFQVFFLMCCVFWSEEIYEMKYGMRFFGYCADMRLEVKKSLLSCSVLSWCVFLRFSRCSKSFGKLLQFWQDCMRIPTCYLCFFVKGSIFVMALK